MPEKSQAFFDKAKESYLTAPTGRRTRSNMPLDGKPVRRRTVGPRPLIELSVPQKRKRIIRPTNVTLSPPHPNLLPR
jgi:paired amphipathic helix protein Sin3a